MHSRSQPSPTRGGDYTKAVVAGLHHRCRCETTPTLSLRGGCKPTWQSPSNCYEGYNISFGNILTTSKQSHFVTHLTYPPPKYRLHARPLNASFHQMEPLDDRLKHDLPTSCHFLLVWLSQNLVCHLHTKQNLPILALMH